MSGLVIQLAAAALGAGIGAWIGHARVLCADGSCPMTGSWYGAALVGGLLAFSLAGSYVPRVQASPATLSNEEASR